MLKTYVLCGRKKSRSDIKSENLRLKIWIIHANTLIYWGSVISSRDGDDAFDQNGRIFTTYLRMYFAIRMTQFGWWRDNRDRSA